MWAAKPDRCSEQSHCCAGWRLDVGRALHDRPRQTSCPRYLSGLLARAMRVGPRSLCLNTLILSYATIPTPSFNLNQTRTQRATSNTDGLPTLARRTTTEVSKPKTIMLTAMQARLPPHFRRLSIRLHPPSTHCRPPRPPLGRTQKPPPWWRAAGRSSWAISTARIAPATARAVPARWIQCRYCKSQPNKDPTRDKQHRRTTNTS